MITFLLCWLTLSVNSQVVDCDYYLTYTGPPGSNYEQTFSVKPGQLLQIDFCTINVPDKLVINDNLIFNIGGDVIFSSGDDYHGYCEFVYEDGNLEVSELNSPYPPNDIHCVVNNPAHRGGMMRLFYRVDSNQCLLNVKIFGNQLDNTIYEVCLFTLEPGFGEVQYDTVLIDVCQEVNPYTIFRDCINEYFIPKNREITEIPIIKEPSCIGHHDGSIEFPNFPWKNQYNLGPGIHQITLDNGFCQREYEIEFEDERICEWFIPNAFSPNGDGINDIFGLFTKINYPYHLQVFDRWGECLFDEEVLSNWQGWDGTFNGKESEIGVYVWKIECLDKILVGDVTLIK